MTKERKSTGSFLTYGNESGASTKKAAKEITKGAWRRVKLYYDPIAEADEVDPFDLLDLVGSGAPDAQVISAGESLFPAPCTKCRIETCPGSVGECLLNTNPTLALTGAENDENDEDGEEINQWEHGNKRDILRKPEPIQGARTAKAYVRSSGSGSRGACARLFMGLPKFCVVDD